MHGQADPGARRARRLTNATLAIATGLALGIELVAGYYGMQLLGGVSGPLVGGLVLLVTAAVVWWTVRVWHEERRP